MSSVRERDEIADEYTWDLESVYDSAEAWESAFERATADVDELGE